MFIVRAQTWMWVIGPLFLYAVERLIRLVRRFQKVELIKVDIDDISINQSIQIYIAPLQDTYSEALQTQAKRKRTVFRSWWN